MSRVRQNEFGEQMRLRRDEALSTAMKRKEEYLGARVPKELRERVIQCAKEKGISVSILIRNILEEEFKEASDEVSADSKSTQNDAKSKFASVLGWKKITLTRFVACSGCGSNLQAGAEVKLGLGGANNVVLCSRCEEAI